jgi:hypothetical protein
MLLAEGQASAQEGRQATRARGALRRGQSWIRWDVGRAACAGAECPGDGCAEARGRAPAGVRQGPRGGCSQVWRRAVRGSSAPSRGVRALVECIRAKTEKGGVALIVVSSMSPQQPWSLCPATSLKYDAKSKKRQGLLQYMYMY